MDASCRNPHRSIRSQLMVTAKIFICGHIINAVYLSGSPGIAAILLIGPSFGACKMSLLAHDRERSPPG